MIIDTPELGKAEASSAKPSVRIHWMTVAARRAKITACAPPYRRPCPKVLKAPIQEFMTLAISVSLEPCLATFRRCQYQNISPMDERGENKRGSSAVWPCARRIASSIACALSSTDPTARLGIGWRSSILGKDSASLNVLLDSLVCDLGHFGSMACCVAIASRNAGCLPGQSGSGRSHVSGLRDGTRRV
jgi:hypothetical protein